MWKQQPPPKAGKATRISCLFSEQRRKDDKAEAREKGVDTGPTDHRAARTQGRNEDGAVPSSPLPFFSLMLGPTDPGFQGSLNPKGSPPLLLPGFI